MRICRNTFFVALIIVTSVFCARAQETGGIKGRIFTESERPVAGVLITARDGNAAVKTVSTDKNGEFLLDGLKEGKYDFTFSRNGFNSGTLNNVEIRRKKIRNLGNKTLETDESDLILIKGSVFDRNGRSIYGAKVSIEKIDGGEKKPRPVLTSESGDFTFRFAKAAATYRVTAAFDGKSTSKEVSVTDAAIYRLALTLDLALR